MNDQDQTQGGRPGAGPDAGSEGAPLHRPPAPAGRRAIYLVLLIAAVLRLAVFISARHAVVLEPYGFLDDAYYYQLARQVAAVGPAGILRAYGGGINISAPGPFFLSPLYIYFLGLVYALLATGITAPFLIQSLAGAAAVWVVFKTGKGAFGPSSGLIAAALMALDGLAAMYGCTLLAASLDPLLTALFFYALLRAARGGNPWSWALAGLAAGLLALNRPNALVLIPLAALVPLWKERRAGLKPAALCLAAAALVIAPVTIRNYAVSGDFVLISSQGGLNFYIGNRAGAPGYYLAPEWMDPDVRGQAEGAREYLEHSRGRPLSDAKVSSILYGMAWRDIAAHPAAWTRLLGYKTLLLLNAREAALNLSLGYMRREVEPALWLLPVGMWLLIPLGFAGVAATRKRPETRLIVVMSLAYGATVVLFFVSDRYRLPLHVPLALLSGAAVQGVIAAWRGRRGRELAMILAAACAALVVSAPDVGVPTGEGQMRLDHALRLIQHGRVDKAQALIEKMPAGAMNPFVWRLRLGRAYAGARRWDLADEQFDILTGMLPDSGPLRCEIGKIYLENHKFGRARAELRIGVKLSPDDKECRDNLKWAIGTLPY
jgi:4-amino-4-deoxy-L-arabinose transferase-like glycosyltransferase